MSQYGRQAFCIYKSGGKTITTALPDIFMVSQKLPNFSLKMPFRYSWFNEENNEKWDLGTKQ